MCVTVTENTIQSSIHENLSQVSQPLVSLRGGRAAAVLSEACIHDGTGWS